MSLWGDKDTKAVTGTVAVTGANTTVTGTSTDFVAELAAGQTLVVATVPYTIASVANTTSLELSTAYAGSTASGLTVTANESPAYVAHADKPEVYGVDATEAAELTEITHAGWVKRTVGTGGRSGRVSYETLVAMSSISGDAEDTVFVDATITIGTQPVAASVTAPGAATFEVAATATQSAVIGYAWQVSDDAGDTWASATGGVYSDEDTDTLAISDSTGLDAYLYRCVLTATGAATVTSDEVELTVAAAP